WEETADRCLACANCTLVCPTCFCSSVEEVSDLTGDEVRRERTWASCFTAEHSTMNSGAVRKSVASRYRQWLTHKLAGWIDQFGVSGCVGCGRCITWCPVGIDLTEEVAAIRGEN
ncbi:MAG: 4Fe-4S dicluster domain-containing protein, partial [Planctomycetales bacterium]|nr:4Fe-4S dicluster domain-containing protein [Planctomycetales bacterium]